MVCADHLPSSLGISRNDSKSRSINNFLQRLVFDLNSFIYQASRGCILESSRGEHWEELILVVSTVIRTNKSLNLYFFPKSIQLGGATELRLPSHVEVRTCTLLIF